MSEKETKKPTEGNTSKPNRDKNGRFTNDKKTDDGYVKINVVKEDKKKSSSKPDNPEKDNTESADKGPNINGFIFHMTGEIPFPEFPVFPTFPRFPRFFHFPSLGLRRLFSSSHKEEEQKPSAPTIEDFAQYVSEKNPETLNFNGKKYYSEEFVSKVVAETITQCAKKAVEDEEEAKKIAIEQENLEKAQEELRKKARNHRIAEKLSKICANFLTGIIFIGVGSTAGFGLVQLYHFLVK